MDVMKQRLSIYATLGPISDNSWVRMVCRGYVNVSLWRQSILTPKIKFHVASDELYWRTLHISGNELKKSWICSKRKIIDSQVKFPAQLRWTLIKLDSTPATPKSYRLNEKAWSEVATDTTLLNCMSDKTTTHRVETNGGVWPMTPTKTTTIHRGKLKAGGR